MTETRRRGDKETRRQGEAPTPPIADQDPVGLLVSLSPCSVTRSLFLIGPRGSGKTTVARLLAARLGWDWVDADDVLEARHGKSIRDVFAEEGEAGFRDRESAVLADLCGRRRCVVSTGGGVVVREANRALAAGVGLRRLADGRRRDAVAAVAGRRPHRRAPAGADRGRPGGGRGSAARPRTVVPRSAPI